jgi:hypothetical protein
MALYGYARVSDRVDDRCGEFTQPKTHDNALISPRCVGALPWSHPSFPPHSASSLW